MRNPYDAIGRIGLLLAIAGAVNWLLVGVFQWNLVKWIFTQSGTQTVSSTGERIVYVVVGVGGVLAIPMLAATLARARGARDERYAGERYAGERTRPSDADDNETAFYYGAPKDARAEDRGDIAASGADTATGQSVPMRKTERVIIRTEEPLTGSAEGATTESSTSSIDRSFSYGAVEEADDEYDAGTEERRAA
jgi:uncharacterized protein